ncbi:MAG: hypothetical protein JWM46_169 [Candidatus Kaiserbacteria bacterium]|nr:hypothetical protein [Candidatus Kaiserbacteria bacterium]
MEQTIDLGISRGHLESYLEATGYWGDAVRRRRNTYVLSPSAYVISPDQKKQLDRLSKATFNAVRTLSTHLSDLAGERSLTNKDAVFLALAGSGLRGLLGPKDIAGKVPPCLKVDLVQDERGVYQIAEVDAYNPRGFGYMALLDESMPNSFPRSGPGVSAVADLMIEAAGEGEWAIIVSEHERFYQPAFDVFRRALAHRGVYARLVYEDDVRLLGTDIRNVFVIPESLNQNIWARAHLLDRYKRGELCLFYPPAAYLGSKAFLPYLAAQEGMAEFIPACSLVCRRVDPLLVCNGYPSVLKGVMSSGMKQVIFSDADAELFRSKFAEARSQKRPSWILQKLVSQKPIPIVVFDEKSGLTQRDHFLRITAYISEKGLVGAEVTGRPDPKVHGAPDCIQIPTILA